jgi:hypothetical protein
MERCVVTKVEAAMRKKKRPGTCWIRACRNFRNPESFRAVWCAVGSSSDLLGKRNGGLNLNLAWQSDCGDRRGNLQHAIVVFGSQFFGQDTLGNRQSALENAVVDLRLEILDFFLFPNDFPFRADGEQVMLRVYFHALEFNDGSVTLQRYFLASLVGATVVSRARCAYCQQPIEEIHWHEHPPAVLSPEQKTTPWNELAPEKLPEVFETHLPVCWGLSHGRNIPAGTSGKSCGTRGRTSADEAVPLRIALENRNKSTALEITVTPEWVRASKR